VATANLKLHAFGSAADPLVGLSHLGQPRYLRHYLADLGAKTVLEETAYFDRDYLSEFAAFYGVSSRGYPNRCRRCHFFACAVDRRHIRSAAGGSASAIRRLQENYLGFVVIRPIPSAPLGRTVLRWYPESQPQTPRVTDPSRHYECHVAGFTLEVTGLAWQQQDTAVGACATVALWSMLHSSAFDDHHAIPTTASITRYAHRTASLGSRLFPSGGLTIYQLLEAIKEAGLAPVVLQGDLAVNGDRGFSKERFTSACAALIRSGYPALVLGELENVGRHAVCAVGFRESGAVQPPGGQVLLQDAGVQNLYVHDDNLGPSVKFEIIQDPVGNYVRLKTAPPPPRHNLAGLPADPTSGYPNFIPAQLVAAVHEDLRMSPDRLHDQAIQTASAICAAYNGLVQGQQLGLTVSTRFIKLHEYLGPELGRMLGGSPKILSKVRLTLAEKVDPMSLHLGVSRIGWGATPLVDVLHDTTDSDTNLYAFCHLQFDPNIGQLTDALSRAGHISAGVAVPAY